ncbi:MAG TPA: peptidylprolyl isomerase [Kofleriaceae bacterium]|nr:peptidylprolyl isomerase [Kofleriaceae bacterium]
MKGAWLKIVREPLLHFLLIGAALFAFYREPAPPPAATAEAIARTPIVVDDQVRQTLITGWQQAHQAAPTDAELDDAIDRWIDREVLYREGLERGFDRDDVRVRSWVSSKMEFVLSSQSLIPPPTEDQLRAFFAADPDRYVTEELIDFSQVFVDGDDEAAKQRAAKLLRLVQNGASANGLGDRFSGGRHYRRRKIGDLAKAFGDEFVFGLSDQPVGTWAMRKSRFGYHVVRVDARTPAKNPDFDDVRLRVQKAWTEKQQADAVNAKVKALRKHWTVVIEP